jgi:DNA-binding XRE family transcriptional regulator
MTYHAAMTKIPSHWPKGIKTADEMLAAALEADPEFAVEWERLALARMVAARLIGYRSDHGLSQRELAERLGVSQPRVVELESGEKNPQIETLVKVAAATDRHCAGGPGAQARRQSGQGHTGAHLRRRFAAGRRRLTATPPTKPPTTPRIFRTHADVILSPRLMSA